MERKPLNETAPLDLNSREKLEKRLAEAKGHLADMEYDLKNGRYPNGVPVEYHDDMDKMREEIFRLEDAIDDLNSNPPETER